MVVIQFDSQNNAAGGYAICPTDMFYYEKTVINIKWTQQHGCGNGDNTRRDNVNNPSANNCQVVVQLGCEDAMGTQATTYYPMSVFSKTSKDGSFKITDGRPDGNAGSTCVTTAPITWSNACKTSNNTICDGLNTNDANQRNVFNSATCRCSDRKLKTYAQHEPEISYLKCRARQRNKGLFTADKQVNGETAVFTRQNPDGNGNNDDETDRHGFECPEERDYFPYWAPTGWRDLAVLTTETEKCEYYKTNSENVARRGECISSDANVEYSSEYCRSPFNSNSPNCCWFYNNDKACSVNPVCRWRLSEPLKAPEMNCLEPSYTQTNNLGFGNSFLGVKTDYTTTSDKPNMPTFPWTIPTLDELGIAGSDLKCVIRLRYNITPKEVDFSFTAANNNAIKTNPVVCIGDTSSNNFNESLCFRHAIETAQTARTFEDRSQVFSIRRRPEELQNANIVNVNVMGKRGNIAQVRNCVEYKYEPSILRARVGDYVHYQVCGSDFNDPNNEGEGRDGTDRSNLLPLANSMALMADKVSNVQVFDIKDLTALAMIGQDTTQCYNTSITQLPTKRTNNNENKNDVKLCSFLNGAMTPYFTYLAQLKSTGSYNFLCSRNNNFSNRDQKLVMNIDEADSSLSKFKLAGIVSGSLIAVAAIGGGAFWYVRGRRHGHLLMSWKSVNRA